MTKGVRRDVEAHLMQPGEYGLCPVHKNFMCVPPGEENQHLLANLAKHKVVEHEDSTITISPSILVQGHRRNATGQREVHSWHGYLERGVWRVC